jgi:alpha-mannosidase
MVNNATNTPIQLFVVSTSHMDWDWNQTFEEYYQTNSGSTPVKTILQNAIALLQDVTLSIPYQYNLAEIAWLQRFLREFPNQLGVLQNFTPNQLVFLGGGITSPDNLVCNGEAFIRNYLVGRRFLKEMKLDAALTDVCWIPDDFGQDPQLPVVLHAMGMNGVSFWRVPGNEPSPPNGNPQIYDGCNYVPTNGTAPISYQLMQDGVTFFWQAADGSKILTQQMSSGYGVIWNQATSGDGEQEGAMLNTFVNNSGLQPGNLLMAPCGGDFSDPSANLLDAVNYYNSHYATTNKVTAGLATFQDFINAMNAYEAANPGTLQTIAMDASNFWTGYFASRPQLKINQQQGVNMLLATETLGTLLQAQSPVLANQWTAIAPTIAEAWELLSPSTHHDYITGTSPDNVYADEQLPLGNKALLTAQTALEQALALLGGAVKTNTAAGQVAYIVYNPSGFRRMETGNLVEIPANPDLAGMNSVWVNEGTTLVPIQRTSSGHIVFPCYTDVGTPSMMYTTVYFTAQVIAPPNTLPDAGLDSYTLSNGLVSITAAANSGWAITNLIDIGNNNFPVLKSNGLGNQLLLYRETNYNSSSAYGNIYQMGNEQAPTATNGSGFYTDSHGAFTAVTDNGTYAASVVDNGPYVWRLQAKVANTATDAVAEITYSLYANEPLVRMEITGNAATTLDNSIVATWAISDNNDNVPSGMLYGTGNHWNDAATPQSDNPYAFTPYWNGPNFRPVHDYLTLQPFNNPAGEPMAAVYNEAMRAWSYYDGLLLGTLFRNPPGTQRGAHGTDIGTVTQRYAFRVPGAKGIGRPETCQPLQESIAFQQPLLAAAVAPFAGVAASLPESATLVAPIASNCLVRVARPQEPVQNASFSFVLRIYQPTNNTAQNWQFNLPVGGPGIQLEMVTALEAPLAQQPAQPPVFSNGAITIYDMPTLATLQVRL